MNRRGFLARTTAGTLGLVAGTRAYAQDEPKSRVVIARDAEVMKGDKVDPV